MESTEIKLVKVCSKVNVDFKFLLLRLKISKCLLPKVSNTKAYSELSANV